MKRRFHSACLAAVLAVPSLLAAQEKGALTAPVERKDLPIEIDLSGTFKALDTAEISVEPEEYAGNLILLKLAPEGSLVKEGDLLMKFDKRDLQKALGAAQGAIDEAQLKLDKAKADLAALEVEQGAAATKLRKELDQARLRRQGAEQDLAIKLEEKRKGVRNAEFGLTDGRVNLEQLQGMYKRRELHTETENILLAREERGIREQERALEEARGKLAHFETYEMPLEKGKLDIEVDQKAAEIRKAEIKAEVDLKEKRAALGNAERDLVKAQEKKAGLEKDLEKLTVRAPRDGILFYGSVGSDNPIGITIMKQMRGELRVGGRVTTHQVLMTVASMDNLSVEMRAHENDIQHVKAGLPLTIRPDAFPDLSISGQVKEVGQVATRNDLFNETREFSVTGTYDGQYPQLRAGMNCRVTLHADRIPDALQVPVVAVFEEGGKYFCYVREDGKPVKRPVKTGAANGKAVQITEGLEAGETVFLNDPFQE